MNLAEDISQVFSSPSFSRFATTYFLVENQPIQSQPQAIFRELLPKLEAQTRLPIRLPSYIPESDSSYPLYAHLESANASKYQIQLVFTEDCTGETACYLGSIVAEAVTSQSPALRGKTMALADDITGYFRDATCGANCSDATLIWEQNSVRYTIALKAGRLETLIKMANSMVLL
ncbi:MAG TPA: hypothetical protein ACFCUY_15760 [Xenococcaceae cyanobacterium]